jgi:hypothetical protein
MLFVLSISRFADITDKFPERSCMIPRLEVVTVQCTEGNCIDGAGIHDPSEEIACSSLAYIV